MLYIIKYEYITYLNKRANVNNYLYKYICFFRWSHEIITKSTPNY